MECEGWVAELVDFLNHQKDLGVPVLFQSDESRSHIVIEAQEERTCYEQKAVKFLLHVWAMGPDSHGARKVTEMLRLALREDIVLNTLAMSLREEKVTLKSTAKGHLTTLGYAGIVTQQGGM